MIVESRESSLKYVEGSANEDNFVRHQQPQDQSSEPIPTNNVLSAYAASNDANHTMSPNIPNNHFTVRSTNEEQSQRLQSSCSSSPLPTNSN